MRKQTQLNYSTYMYSLGVLISNLPDEVIAVTFEEGMYPRGALAYHLGILVSHAPHLWREASIVTPRL